MSLKAAVGWSVVFHLFLLAVQPSQGFVPAAEERRLRLEEAPLRGTFLDRSVEEAAPLVISKSPIQVAYVKLQPPASLLPEAAPASPKKPPASAAVSVPKPPPREAAPQPVVPSPAPAVQGQPVTIRDVISPASSVSVISNLPEGEFAALQHKQRVRQHLKTRLIFPSDGIQGTVRLRLILAPNGTLQDLVLLEASDSRLAEMTLQKAQSAAPFPPFPPQMKKSQALYEYVIQYRLE